MAEKMIEDVKRFAKSYRPQDDDHPDLESRVVMFKRAVESGSKRTIAAHARTLHRFLGHVRPDAIGSKRSSSTAAATDDGPTKRELQAEAEARGLSKSGSKADLQARIDEYDAAPDADDDDAQE